MYYGYVFFRVFEEMILDYQWDKLCEVWDSLQNKMEREKIPGVKMNELITVDADECLVCAWVFEIFHNKKYCFFKVSVMGQKFSSLEKSEGWEQIILEALPSTHDLIKNNLLFFTNQYMCIYRKLSNTEKQK